MAIRDIALMGNPVLDRPAAPVADPTALEVRALVADMRDTMAAAGGIGLAAPQIGVSQRLVIFYVPDDGDDRPESLAELEERVLINPTITPVSKKREEDWEACLSVPGLKGLVPRYARIRYTGVDLDGHPIDVEAAGFHARVVQHECDHLDGILYPKRLTDLSKLAYVSQWEAVGDRHPAEEEVTV